MRFRFDDFEADSSRFTVTRSGETVPIEPKPLRLLLHLLARHPAVVSKQELFEALWSAEQVTEQSLTRAVRSARRALGRPEVIRNYRGRGYGIGVAVERIVPERDSASEDTGDPFVGREAELAALLGALDESSAGRGRVVLLAGEPGIGKTRTAGELARRALARGAEVVWGRVVEEQGAPALWPWLQVLRALARRRDAASLRAALGPAVEAVAAVVPEIREQLPRVGEPVQLAPDQERFRFFDGVAQLLARLSADGPLVLVFDDLHAADPTSLDLFVFVARELADARVLLLGTYRNVGAPPSDALDAALANLARLPGASPPIVLQGLSREEVERLIALVPGAAAARAEEIHARSDGNPFFVRELLRLADPRDGAITAGVRAVVNTRVEGLDERVRAALETAAVIGREAPLDLLAASLGADPGTACDWLEAAQRAGFLEELGEGAVSGFRFAHAVVQETLYAGIPRRRRRELHRLVGEALETRHAGLLEPHLVSLAQHFEWAGDAAKSAGYAVRAGDQARSRFAFEEAASAYARALALLGAGVVAERRCDLLLALAEARRLAGRTAGAIEAFGQAADVAREHEDAGRLARAASGMTDCGEPIFPHPEALALVEEAITRLGRQEPSLRVGLLGRRAKLLLTYLSRHEDEAAIALGDLAVAEALRLDDPEIRADALSHRLVIHQARPLERPAPERMRMAEEALEAARLVHRDDLALEARRHLIAIAVELGDAPLLDAEIQRFARESDRVRIRSQRHLAAAYLAMHALQQGRFRDAELWIGAAETLADPADPLETYQTPTVQRLLLPSDPGRDPMLEGVIREMAARFPVMPQWWLALAVFCIERGRLEEAREIVDRVAPPGFMEGLPRTVGWLFAASALARIYFLLERRAEAAPLLDLLGPYAGVRVVVGFGIACHGPIAYDLGRLAGLLGRHDEAAAHLRAALAQDLRLEARPWQARDRFALARVLLARGEEAAARREADTARAIAQSIGMGALLAHVEGLPPL